MSAPVLRLVFASAADAGRRRHCLRLIRPLAVTGQRPCHHRARIGEQCGIGRGDEPARASQIHELPGLGDLRHAVERVRGQVDREDRHLAIEPEECPRHCVGGEPLANQGERNHGRTGRLVAMREASHQILVLQDEYGCRRVAHEGG